MDWQLRFKVFKKGGFKGLITAIPALMGLSTAMDTITPDRAPSIDAPDARKAKPRGRFGRIFDFAKRNLKKVNPKLLLGGAWLQAATAVGATTALTPSNDIDTPKSAKPRILRSGGLDKAKELISKKN